MAKDKNYEQAFEDLIVCLHKNTNNAKCVTALKYLVDEYKGKLYLKKEVVKDYASFLNFWFPYIQEMSKASKWMQNYLLSKRFVIPDPWRWFQRIYYLELHDESDRKRMASIYSHTQAIVKALIQTQRRKLGFDQNSTKY